MGNKTKDGHKSQSEATSRAEHQDKADTRREPEETTLRKRGSGKRTDDLLPEKHVEGPGLGGQVWRKAFTRLGFSLLLMVFVYYSTRDKETPKVLTLATTSETIGFPRGENVVCSSQGYPQKEQEAFRGCIPSKRCGRIVSDAIVSREEVDHLLALAKRGFALGGSSGSASVLDLHSGALSYGDAFINVYRLAKSKGLGDVFTPRDFEVYKRVVDKIHAMVCMHFGVAPNKLYPTKPSFFSRITSKPPSTVHDEYWHLHVDKETYPSFHYTSLLYLSTHGQDFSGGRFIFVDNVSGRNLTVEPKLGRVSAFTSGHENPHFVEKVTEGTRFALTVSFTCDKDQTVGEFPLLQ